MRVCMHVYTQLPSLPFFISISLALIIPILRLQLLHKLNIAALSLLGRHALIHNLLPLVVLVLALVTFSDQHCAVVASREM